MHISWRKKFSCTLRGKLSSMQSRTHVTLHHSAVGDSGGVIRFTHNRLNSGNSRVCDGGETEVTLTTLDHALGADASVVDLLVTNDSHPQELLLAESLQC
jgi:hypothetical protein